MSLTTMTTATPTSSSDLSEAKFLTASEDLARALGTFFNGARFSGEPLTEGMIISALGVLFASKAKDDEQCQKYVLDLRVAIYSQYQLRKAR